MLKIVTFGHVEPPSSRVLTTSNLAGFDRFWWDIYKPTIPESGLSNTFCLKERLMAIDVAQSKSRPLIADQSVGNSVLCPACGVENAQPRTFQFDSGRGVTPWARCTSCDTYFMTSTYDVQVETDHTRHMAWGNEDEGSALNQKRRYGYVWALSKMEELGYGGSKLLDVGCSFGGILVEARKRGFECAGLDIVPEAVAYVQQLGIPAQECSSLNDCTLFSEQNPADVISVLDAHIYWPDQPAELRAIHRLLRDDGLLVLRAITKSALITAGRYVGSFSPGLSKKMIRRAISDHRFSMPLKSLLRTVEQAGFEIVSATPRGTRDTNEMPLDTHAAHKVGTYLWHGLGISVAPASLIFARKKLPDRNVG
ncbi:MAG: methyltransferase domain-containing protein [Fuerstiella sp.]